MHNLSKWISTKTTQNKRKQNPSHKVTAPFKRPRPQTVRSSLAQAVRPPTRKGSLDTEKHDKQRTTAWTPTITKTCATTDIDTQVDVALAETLGLEKTERLPYRKQVAPKMNPSQRNQTKLRFTPRSLEMMELSDGQSKFLCAAASGANIFLTGSAGSGKSASLRLVLNLSKGRTKAEQLEKMNFSCKCEHKDTQSCLKRLRKKTIAVTATTGTAAVLVNGQTIHSWAGMFCVFLAR